MKILLVSTFYKRGGAARATNRLFQALTHAGVDVRLGYMLDDNSGSNTFSFLSSMTKKAFFWIAFIRERLAVFFHLSSRRYTYKFSVGHFGQDITQHPAVKEADVVHLHWVSFGTLSLDGIAQLSKLKPVIWTFHDLWPFTGGCHIPLDCRQFTSDCSSCFYLKKTSQKLSIIGLQDKVDFHKLKYKGKIGVVSTWLQEMAEMSMPIGHQPALLTNALDVNKYLPRDKEGKDFKQLYSIPEGVFCIGSGAADLTDEIKGFSYFVKVLQALEDRQEDVYVVLLGHSEEGFEQYQYVKVVHVPFLSSEDDMVAFYSALDCFVLTSIQETLSYTTMESMACGTPVAAFNCGGVRDLIDHGENGYLAENRNSEELYSYILKMIHAGEGFRAKARAKVVESFDEQIVAQNHLEVYRALSDTERWIKA